MSPTMIPTKNATTGLIVTLETSFQLRSLSATLRS